MWLLGNSNCICEITVEAHIIVLLMQPGAAVDGPANGMMRSYRDGGARTEGKMTLPGRYYCFSDMFFQGASTDRVVNSGQIQHLSSTASNHKASDARLSYGLWNQISSTSATQSASCVTLD